MRKGGAGRDTFRFTSVHDSAPGTNGTILSPRSGYSQRDVITDFTHGQDKIDLSPIDANSKLAGNQAFKFKASADFSHKAGELIYEKFDARNNAHDKTIVYGDTNGDGRADFQIELTGLHTLRGADFIL